MEYSVGQVIYLLNPKSLTIIPALIVEEVVRKTISKQTRQYVVDLPGENGNSKIYIEDIQEVIFSDVKKLREHMLENTRKSIEQLINNALEKKDIFFGTSSTAVSIDVVLKEEKKETLIDNKNAKKHMQKNVKDVIMNSNNNLTKEAKWKLFF